MLPVAYLGPNRAQSSPGWRGPGASDHVPERLCNGSRDAARLPSLLRDETGLRVVGTDFCESRDPREIDALPGTGMAQRRNSNTADRFRTKYQNVMRCVIPVVSNSLS